MTAPTATKPKLRQVWLSIDEIRPSPENELIYRRISAQDPEIQALAQSIRDQGILDPIVVTEDNYIVSGHRRHAACRAAGMVLIPCRIVSVTRDDPDFEKILVEYNRQRVKTFAETVREQVVMVKPAEAYRSLIEHRRKTSAVRGDFITIEGAKTRGQISPAKQPMLKRVQMIITGLIEYWPLSDRTIHYELLNDPPLRHSSKPDSWYTNHRSCYQDLCDLLTRARLAGEIPFNAIDDPTRKIAAWSVDQEVGVFINKELDHFLKGYWRDLQQSQPNHIEIIGEKNTIEGSIREVAQKYCVPYTLGRGYCSLDPRYKMSQRFKASGKSKLILLIMSDLDPEGEDIAHSFTRSMRDDFGIAEIHGWKVCLTFDQARQRNLPPNFDIKKTSKRSAKFEAKYGESVYELEALPPSERARLLTEAIDEVLDVDSFNAELDAEEKDAARLKALRDAVVPAIRETTKAQDLKEDDDI
jgi:hypothetical protein